jgi:ATP-binding cassette subfamily C (CFTR/MRP) protein 1
MLRVTRLNTIAYYDRILVMDAGQAAEYDVSHPGLVFQPNAKPVPQTPLNLFDNESSVFRSLCNEANLTRQDIVRIRTNADEIVLPLVA